MMFLIWQVVAGATARYRRLSEERGSVAAEYSLLVTLIALAIIAAVIALGVAVAVMFQNGADSLP